ncbi:MAG: VOC family protein [Phycisphaerales bacterium]
MTGTGRAIDHVVLATRDLDGAAGIYQSVGFTLTPRAAHTDRMGTSNRLAQFVEENFIELLEVDRPATLVPHDLSQAPPFFSFGAFNRDFLDRREGVSMLVFESGNARADLARFQAAGTTAYAPFDFDRLARLPGGDEVTVSFSLGFATSPDMPHTAFFVCQNRAREHFWKPPYQAHANRATGLRAVYLASPEPQRDAAFIGSLFGGELAAIPDGMSVRCGERQEVRVLAPEAIARKDPSFRADRSLGPLLAGVAVRTEDAGLQAIPSERACGMFLEWIVEPAAT